MDVSQYARIQNLAADLLKGDWNIDDIEMDRRLGELEAAIYTARQAISDEWRSARRDALHAYASSRHPNPRAPQIPRTIDDLLL